jgi:hypothetical protein
VRENEEQAAWALETLPLAIDALPEPEGFAPVPLALTGLDGVLRVGCQDQGMGGKPGGIGQGFFLARFQKDADPGARGYSHGGAFHFFGRPSPDRART